LKRKKQTNEWRTNIRQWLNKKQNKHGRNISNNESYSRFEVTLSNDVKLMMMMATK
jgi:hypothetical protein